MYNIGDRIVHPMHGAGIVDDIITQTVNGKTLEYYILKLPSNNMTIMIPVATSDKIGIRDVISEERANELISLAATLDTEQSSNWNQRYRDNAAKIKSGNLDEVVRVIKSLTYRDIKNGLSTGERKMLHSAKHILLSELVLAKNADYKDIEQELEDAITSVSK